MKIYVVIDEHGEPGFASRYSAACHEHINSAIAEHDIVEAAKWSVIEFSTDARPDRAPAETLPCRPARPDLPKMFEYEEKP